MCRSRSGTTFWRWRRPRLTSQVSDEGERLSLFDTTTVSTKILAGPQVLQLGQISVPPGKVPVLRLLRECPYQYLRPGALLMILSGRRRRKEGRKCQTRTPFKIQTMREICSLERCTRQMMRKLTGYGRASIIGWKPGDEFDGEHCPGKA